MDIKEIELDISDLGSGDENVLMDNRFTLEDVDTDNIIII
jgi:hypothetical protein